MPTIHSLSFTPAVSCDIVVTCLSDLYARKSSGGSGGFMRLFRTQSSVTVNGNDSTMFPDASPVSYRSVMEARFTVTGGALCTVGLDATVPIPGGYSFRNIDIKVEEIKR